MPKQTPEAYVRYPKNLLNLVGMENTEIKTDTRSRPKKITKLPNFPMVSSNINHGCPIIDLENLQENLQQKIINLEHKFKSATTEKKHMSTQGNRKIRRGSLDSHGGSHRKHKESDKYKYEKTVRRNKKKLDSEEDKHREDKKADEDKQLANATLNALKTPLETEENIDTEVASERFPSEIIYMQSLKNTSKRFQSASASQASSSQIIDSNKSRSENKRVEKRLADTFQPTPKTPYSTLPPKPLEQIVSKSSLGATQNSNPTIPVLNDPRSKPTSKIQKLSQYNLRTPDVIQSFESPLSASSQQPTVFELPRHVLPPLTIPDNVSQNPELLGRSFMQRTGAGILTTRSCSHVDDERVNEPRFNSALRRDYNSEYYDRRDNYCDMTPRSNFSLPPANNYDASQFIENHCVQQPGHMSDYNLAMNALIQQNPSSLSNNNTFYEAPQSIYWNGNQRQLNTNYVQPNYFYKQPCCQERTQWSGRSNRRGRGPQGTYAYGEKRHKHERGPKFSQNQDVMKDLRPKETKNADIIQGGFENPRLSRDRERPGTIENSLMYSKYVQGNEGNKETIVSHRNSLHDAGQKRTGHIYGLRSGSGEIQISISSTIDTHNNSSGERTNRIATKSHGSEIKNNVAILDEAHCGPDSTMETTKDSTQNLEVPKYILYKDANVRNASYKSMMKNNSAETQKRNTRRKKNAKWAAGIITKPKKRKLTKVERSNFIMKDSQDVDAAPATNRFRSLDRLLGENRNNLFRIITLSESCNREAKMKAAAKMKLMHCSVSDQKSTTDLYEEESVNQESMKDVARNRTSIKDNSEKVAVKVDCATNNEMALPSHNDLFTYSGATVQTQAKRNEALNKTEIVMVKEPSGQRYTFKFGQNKPKGWLCSVVQKLQERNNGNVQKSSNGDLLLEPEAFISIDAAPVERPLMLVNQEDLVTQSELIKETKLISLEASRPKKGAKALQSFMETPNNLYKCPHFSCKFSSNVRTTFVSHLKEHTSDNTTMVPCVYCDVKTSWEYVATHIDIRHAVSIYTCGHCLYRAVAPEYFCFHIKHCHPNHEYVVISVPPHKDAKKFSEADLKIDLKQLCEPYQCSCVNKDGELETHKYLFADEFIKHLRKFHQQGYVQCGYPGCTQKLDPSAMLNHWAMFHKVGIYQCSYCKANSKEIRRMYSHFAQMHPNSMPNILVRKNKSSLLKQKEVGFTDEAYQYLGHITKFPANLMDRSKYEKIKIIEIESDVSKTTEEFNAASIPPRTSASI